MALPRQVQDQLAAAEMIEKQIQLPLDLPAPDTPVEPATPAEPAPTEPAEPTPAPAPTPAPEPEDQKYKVLKGKYDAEVPALHQQNRQLNAQVAQMQQQLQALLQQQQQPRQEPSPAPKQEPGATSKDIDDFGGDMVGMVQRVATSVAAQLASRIDAEFVRLRGEIASLTGKQQLTASQQFDSDLLKAVPDWEEVDASPEWLAWLSEMDPIYGRQRQFLLTEAHQALDAKRVAAIFNAFKGTRPAPAAEAPPAPQAPATNPLANQVAPSRVSAASPTPPAQTVTVWTDAGMQAFAKDISLGKYRGREAEQARIEADLNAAIAEGRYRPR